MLLSPLYFDFVSIFMKHMESGRYIMLQVGYLLGLGARHPSNLMLDRYSGKLLHIDFGDCFEASMHREKFPERVYLLLFSHMWWPLPPLGNLLYRTILTCFCGTGPLQIDQDDDKCNGSVWRRGQLQVSPGVCLCQGHCTIMWPQSLNQPSPRLLSSGRMLMSCSIYGAACAIHVTCDNL